MCFVLAADLILGEEPWLNATTACTFPNPFIPTVNAPQGTENGGTSNFDSAKEQGFPDVNPPNWEKVKQYVGQYGNFGYKNVSVVIDDIMEQPVLVFDLISCDILNISEALSCLGKDEYWFVFVPEISFDDNNPSRFVDITFSTREGPIRFQRDLRFDEAPGPTDDWPECPQTIL